MDNLEVNPGNISPVEKQALSDTYLAFLPKNTAGYTTKNQIIDVQIPRTEHVLRLNEAYFQVELQTSFKANIDYAPATGEVQYVGLLNSATIFDQVYIKNNGKTIHTETFSQIQSRAWQLSKSTNYQIANPAAFLNYDDVSANNGLLVHELTSGAFKAGVEVPLKFRLKIPLSAVYQCFDNCDNFSTTLLNDDITLSMQLSHPNKYMCLITADSTSHKVKRVEPFGINAKIYDIIKPYMKSKITGWDETKDSIVFDTSFTTGTDNSNQVEWKTYTYSEAGTHGTDYVGTITVYTIQVLDDDSKYYIDSLKMVVPGHYPTADESANYANLVANGAVHYSFRDCDIKSQSTDFTNGTQHLNFSTNCENIFSVMMFASHAYSYVVFDKPYVDKIECNLSEIYKLANDKVHTEGTYDRDNDMYKNLIDGFGVDSFKNLQRFDKQITKDFLQKEPKLAEWKDAGNLICDRTSVQTGNYLQWYKVAPGNQMGISADYFANLINYKFESKNDSTHDYACNYSNSNIFCAQLRYRMLIYKEGGIDIVCPFAEELNMRSVASDAPKSDAHGIGALVPMLLKPATGLIGSAVKGIKGIVYKNRAHDNSTYAYSKLGKDGFERHRGILEQNSSMRRRKFKKFINNLVESEKQLANVDTHGLLIRHGEEGTLGEGAGAASTVPRSSLDDFEHERPVDLNLLNLTNSKLYRPNNREILADVEFKMYLVLDYKYGFNKNKLRLQSFGDESATEYCAHGFRDWIRNKWNKLKGFFKGKGKEIAKDAGKAIISNATEIVKQYANEILMGKLNIKDVPSKFKKQVLALIKNNQLTGTPVDDMTQRAIDYYKKIKDGSMNWSQVPSDMRDIVNKLQAQQSTQNGLLIRHGFVGAINVHPSIDYHVMKRRISKLADKNPMLMRQKDLRRLYKFKHFQQHPIVDTTHGRFNELLDKLYRKQQSKSPVFAGYCNKKPVPPSTANPYKDKWRKIKSEITGSDNHGLKTVLIQMKSNPKYKKWDSKKKYKMLKYAKMAAKE